MSVRTKIVAVMAELGAIGKNQTSKDIPYKFRSIDDILSRLQPLMIKHGLFYAPEATDVDFAQINDKWSRARVIVRYTVYDAEDDSSVCAVVPGEGKDNSDKSIGKAMTYAEKTFLTQLFAIPSQNADDPDFEHPTDTGHVASGAEKARSLAVNRRPEPSPEAQGFIDEIEKLLIDSSPEGHWPDRDKIAEVLYLKKGGQYPTDKNVAVATAEYLLHNNLDVWIKAPEAK